MPCMMIGATSYENSVLLLYLDVGKNFLKISMYEEKI